MSTATEQRRPPDVRLPGELRWLLARLRWTIRAYAWLDGLATAAIWLGAAFFLLWLVDWSFEPSWTSRRAAMLVAAVGAAAIVYRLILRRTFARLPRASLAALVERRYAGFDDRLLTAVNLCGRASPEIDANATDSNAIDADAATARQAMLAQTVAEARQLATAVQIRRVFAGRPLLAREATAAVLALAFAATWFVAGDALAFYLQRLAGSPEPWPRKTLLVVEGFWADYALVVPPPGQAAEPEQVHVYTGAVEVRDRDAKSSTDDDPYVIDAGSGAQATFDGDGALELTPVAARSATEIVAPIGDRSRFAAVAAGGGVAVLRRTVDCLWRGDARAYRAGARLSLGQYELISGRAELVLNGGTRLVVAGPAAFEIAGSTKLIVDYGRISVRAPLRPAPFVIETPHAAYVAVPIDHLRVVRGGDVTLTVLADPLRVLPEYVEAAYEGEGGADGRQMLQQEAAAIPGRDEFQRYTLSMKNLLGSLDFEIRGGDGRVSGVKIETVDSPKLVATRAACHFPKYLVDERSGRFTPREFDVAGPLELPTGTDVTLHAQSSKPLRKVEIATGDGETKTIDVAGDRHEFAYAVGPLDRTTALFVTLHDTDGVANRDAIAVQLIAVPDEPPRVAVRLFGVGSTITPNALLRLQGEIADDHALNRGWFVLDVAGEDAATHDLTSKIAGQRRVVLTTEPWRGTDRSPSDAAVGNEIAGSDAATSSETLDLAAFRLPSGRALAEGDQLMVSVRATDRCDLRDKPALGEGDRVPLEVVTVDDLLARLEAREVLLRDKLATVIDELERTRDALGELKLPADDASSTTSHRLLGPQVERAAQNSERSRYETTTLANALDDIGEELATNRLDTSQRRGRLAEQLIVPLRTVAAEGYPKFDARLSTLRTRTVAEDQLAQLRRQLAALNAGPNAAAAATNNASPDQPTATTAQTIVQRIAELATRLANEPPIEQLVGDAQAAADRIVVALRGVLGELADAGDFNQLVDELREISKRQQQLRERTRKEQQKSLLE
ncbi:MAG: hypothetical protein WD875_13235 [Pirellulales bacterium]